MRKIFKSNNATRIVIITLVFVIILGINVLGGNVKTKNVSIKFSDNQEITVITSKTKVEDILKENGIVLEENETVTPSIDEDITNTKQIKISLKGKEPIKVAENVSTELDKEQIKEEYTNITEKIETVIEDIPFETITKDVSNGSSSTKNTIIQKGVNGKRKTTYKVIYKDDIEISREELSSEIIKEPINKIVQIQTKLTITSRGNYTRTTGISGQSGIYKVTAYCSCAKCCGKTNGITASGVKATANHTIAAPSTFKFGTKVVMNGITYTVEDRGGAIQGNRIDIYMDSHQEALQWGVRYVEVEVLK